MELDSDKTIRSNRVREIGNASNANSHRKYRYRSKDESDDNGKPRNEKRILPSNHKESPIDDELPVTRKRPVRIGRRRITTTPIPVTVSNIPMVIPVKVSQAEQDTEFEVAVEQDLVKLNTNRDDDDNKTLKRENSQKSSSSTTIPNIPITTTKPSSSTNATRVTTNVTSSTSTRISFRKVNRYLGNASGKVESVSTETTTQRVIRRPVFRTTQKVETDSEGTTTPRPPSLSRGTVRSSAKNVVKEKPVDDIDDENYPEHFKLFLKANHKSSLPTGTVNPPAAKDTKFKNFKSSRVAPYRGYKQSSSTSTTVAPALEVTSNLRLNFARVNQNDKRSKNISVESNDVYVKDLDLTKDTFNLAKETNYPEIATTSRPQREQDEKIYRVTTFKPIISDSLSRNKLFRHRGPPTRDPESYTSRVNRPVPAIETMATVKEVSRIDLILYVHLVKTNNVTDISPVTASL